VEVIGKQAWLLLGQKRNQVSPIHLQDIDRQSAELLDVRHILSAKGN